MTRARWCSIVITLTGALAACSSSVRHAVDYRGAEYGPTRSAASLPSVAALPFGFETFGSLSAHCTLAPIASAVEGVWLSDVDCSERRLRSALREKASEVGAELLVAERCSKRAAGRRGSASGVRCSARAARANESARASRPLDVPAEESSLLSEIANADQAAWLDDPTGEQAWRIEIRYQPSSRIAPRGPRPAAAVGELPALPVSHVALGMLESRCREECSLNAVRAALRVAAGRLGASDVAEIRCVEHAPGITCIGTAAQSEVEL